MESTTLLSMAATGALTAEQVAAVWSACKAEKPLTYRIDLDKITDRDIYKWFRFTREDLWKLTGLFHLPEKIVLDNRSVFSDIEALCVMLRRLAYPNRWTDLEPLFGRSTPELSMVCTWMIDHIDETFGHLLTELDLCWLSAAELQRFANAIYAKQVPLPDVWGFIDGTFRPLCRPADDQRTLYSGHYRLHGLKFQAVMAPNGLVASLDGPWPGRRHDSGILLESGLLDALAEKMMTIGRVYRLYGDPAYPVSDYLEAPFKTGAHPLTQEQIEFNTAMSSVRIAVEWGFGEVARQFAFLDFAKNLKVGLQPVGKFYSVGTLLVNCRVCLSYGSKVGSHFDLKAPEIEVYLRNHF